MEEVILNLRENKIFDENELKIDKNINFIFGKNGTGKSTLTQLFKSEIKSHDVRIFQGFDSIIGENKKLNAVILGEKNNEIDKEVKILEEEIVSKNNEIKKIKEDTEEQVNGIENLWKCVFNKKTDYDEIRKKIDKFYKESAKKIKNKSNPQIAKTTYDMNNFKSEINNAKLLTKEEVEENKKILREDIKKANKTNIKLIDLNNLLEKTNVLLLNKVREREEIVEIVGNKEKIEFAEKGLLIHKKGEKCAFCGNEITESRYMKLKSFFSADEVKKFKEELEKHCELLLEQQKTLKEYTLDFSNFYAVYEERCSELNKIFIEKKKEMTIFLDKLYMATERKLKELFDESKQIEEKIPDNFIEELEEYNKIVEENNNNNLEVRKEEAKSKLRYNEIKKCLEEFNYYKELEDEKIKKEIYRIENDKLKEKKRDIENLNDKINKINNEIILLKKKTENVEILANEINKKLKLYVNFELKYLKDETGDGNYQIKSKNFDEIRDITQLSSGEKNIIALLYFIQKLNEVDTNNVNLPKLIIFDDPMTSNDDTMQYLIIEELNKLMKKIKRENGKIIILTHNNHFYLNITYDFRKCFKNNCYIRLNSDGKRTKIKKICKESDDFKTSYEALWKELEFLYLEAPNSSMLLNPIRRIIETFTKFNCMNKSKMLQEVVGAKKMFDVNSHSIDDLEADLNGKEKKEIMKIVEECFLKVGAKEHFDNYWSIDLNEKIQENN